MKKLMIFLLIIVLILGGLYLGRNVIAKTALTSGVKAMTGLQLTIGEMNLGIVDTRLEVRQMKLYNPPDFPEKLMCDVPEIVIDYELTPLLKKHIYLQELKFDLKEFVVVKDKDGNVNLDAFKPEEEEGEKEEKVIKETDEEKKGLSFKVDVFDLKIGTVLFKDYTKGEKPQITTYPINIHERFENITDTKQITSIILVKALFKTAIPGLVQFPINTFKNTAGGVMKGATAVVSGSTEIVGKAAEGTVKGVGKAAEGTAKVAGGAVKGVGKTVESLIPFGKKEEDKSSE